MLEPEVSNQIGPVWGLDSDGELRSVWRHSGHAQLYFAIGRSTEGLINRQLMKSCSKEILHYREPILIT